MGYQEHQISLTWVHKFPVRTFKRMGRNFWYRYTLFEQIVNFINSHRCNKIVQIFLRYEFNNISSLVFFCANLFLGHKSFDVLPFCFSSKPGLDVT